jgi:hypothetical protein
MHLVVSLRQRNPTTPIYTQKVDWSKVYRHVLGKRDIAMRSLVR